MAKMKFSDLLKNELRPDDARFEMEPSSLKILERVYWDWISVSLNFAILEDQLEEEIIHVAEA